MKKIIVLLLFTFLLACDDSDGRQQNPFLIDISFQVDLNTNLPQYSNLNFPSNYIIDNSLGIRGVIVYNLGNNQLVAYELADPNHELRPCSTLTVSGITASCPCEDDINTYNILTGQPQSGEGRYGLKAYRAVRSGSIVRVSN